MAEIQDSDEQLAERARRLVDQLNAVCREAGKRNIRVYVDGHSVGDDKVSVRIAKDL